MRRIQFEIRRFLALALANYNLNFGADFRIGFDIFEKVVFGALAPFIHSCNALISIVWMR